VYSGGSFPGGRFIQEKYEILEGTETSDVTSYRTSIEGEAVVFISKRLKTLDQQQKTYLMKYM